MMELLFHTQIGGIFESLWMKLTWRDLHFLVTLLLTYIVTRKVLTNPHDAPSGTIARGVCICVEEQSRSSHSASCREGPGSWLGNGFRSSRLLLQHLDAVFSGHGTLIFMCRVLKDRLG